MASPYNSSGYSTTGQSLRPEVNRLMPSGPTSAQVIAYVDAFRQASLRYNYGLFARLQRWYDSYRGYWQGRLAQFRNNVTIPFTFAMIQADVARKVATTFGAWPIVTFEGYAPEDVARAKKNEVLISAQMKDCKSLTLAVDFMLQADISGVAIARYGWDTDYRKVDYIKYETVAPGLKIPVRHQYDAEQFNGPTWQNIDRLDFWQEPAKTKIDDMRGMIHRYWKDLDELRAEAKNAKAAGEESYYDANAIELLAQAPLQGLAQQEFLARKVMFRNEYDTTARQLNRYAKPIEIWEYHGEVPPELAPDGVTRRCIAIGNGRVVLKNKPLRRIQFLKYSPQRDPFSFDGVGKAEVAYGPQMTVNRLSNQKLDALDQLLDPVWVASNQSNINFQNLFTRAGKIILVDGPADDSNIRPLPPNLSGVQAAYTEISQLYQFMQVGLGINDIILGEQGGGRETARGYLGRQENTMTRLAFEARCLEEEFVEPLADGFRDQDRLMLDLPHEVKILGSLAQINPITGLPYQPEMATIDEDDLVPDYRARAVGASQQIARTARQQNLVSLLQMMSGNPALLQAVNWVNFARQAFELFDFKNVDELLVTQLPALNMVAGGAGTNPQALAAMTGPQGLPLLDPSLTNAMGQSNPTGLMGTLTGGGK